MCGFTGFIDLSPCSRDFRMAVLERMTDTLSHRGPDDRGIWLDDENGIGLGHRRLAVIDLSPAGHQPMLSACGQYVLAFNGEIYNFEQIRAALEAEQPVVWRGHSDTEILLQACRLWGVEKALQMASGMFAFALWDRTEKALYLARDRAGEKPLYFAWAGRTFLFGSELKALRAHPSWQGDIDRNALALYLRHNCIPAPYSIYLDCYKLLPGTLLRVPAEEAWRCPWEHGAQAWPPLTRSSYDYRAYWSALEVAESGLRNPFAGSPGEAIDELERLLRHAVRQQMVADVPLGAFLSGGIDSSTVVALMQAQSERPIQTFTIGFHEGDFDEAGHARAVARHLGTEHTELYVSPEQARAVIPQLATIYDEPFADSSQIPTLLVCRLAREQVTVALSGDGGDELFGGYNRYALGPAIWHHYRRFPRTLRRILAKSMTLLPAEIGNAIGRNTAALLPKAYRYPQLGDKLHKYAHSLMADDPEAIYRSFVTHWEAPARLVLGAKEPPGAPHPARKLHHFDFCSEMMYLDFTTYLPDDILTKVDRASMSVSLESRMPLLDHRIIQFAWHLPPSLKLRDGWGKWILRQVLCRYVPEHLTERPKTGFGIPLDLWLRGPLRQWAEALLDEKRLRREGFFDPVPIRRKWAEHLSGKTNWGHHLWDVLMFQAWLETGSARL
jgi:asparagine synthase (glutamine-hydrolysing)